ncbi:hypothetical protein FBU30_008930 [Linnemannia zychae]|nr:hypothetical protein FBU30_008930 [Linnemannia zychae]
MLDTDSGSSDLSDASSLSSDNSSGSEADIKDTSYQRQSTQSRVTHSLPHHNGSATPAAPSKTKSSASYHQLQSSPVSKQEPFRPLQPKYHSSSSSSSDSGSGTEGSSGDDSTDLDDDGNNGQGKRPPRYIRSSNKYPSKGTPLQHGRKESKQLEHVKNEPISLSDSLPVYSQEIMDGSLMASAIGRNNTAASGRGRGRGRGRAPLAGHGSRIYNTSGTTVIDFDACSPPPEDAVPSLSIQVTPSAQHTQTTSFIPVETPNIVSASRKKKGSPAERQTTKAKSGGTKSKSGTKKVGRPKTVSKDVYCICREPYDGEEFMIACDRCEEWFHGRCIGMKPQEAKKSNHYYCDTCQRIRRMFGVTSSPQEPVAALSKQKKSAHKKSTEKRTEKRDQKADGSAKKQKAKSNTKAAHMQDSDHAHEPMVNMYTGGVQAGYGMSGPIQIQVQQHFPAKQNNLPIHKSPKSTPTVIMQDQSAAFSMHHQQASNPIIPSASAPLSYTATNVTGRSFPNFPSASAACDDDDDEDVCPVCEFECTCNDNGGGVVLTPVSGRTSPEINEPHSMSAIKVPFQPNLESAGPHYPNLDTIDHPSIDIEDDDEDLYSDEAFQVSQKNPMVTPTSQRRPSILQRSGKGMGKAPSLIQSTKKTYHLQRSHGKGLKSSKASMHLYQHSMTNSESGDSDSFSDTEGKGSSYTGAQRYSYVSDASTLNRQEARYESDSDDVVEMDEILSINSASSLSELEDGVTYDSLEKESFQDRGYPSRRTATNRSTSDKGYSQFYTDVTPDEFGEPENRSLAITKKRGPGRPRKPKVPLVVSREDEHALYTPAVNSRRLVDHSSQKRGATKAIRSSLIKEDFPFIAYDPEVANDVRALNSTDQAKVNEAQDAPNSAIQKTETTALPQISENDIFGDGDLSDELSGDLSDILSEDLDDLSDEDVLGFTSGDEDDDTSNSSSPREFNYSEMEEQDESLVDSDSSINSITTEDSGSSDIDTGSDIEPQIQEFTDVDEISDHEESEELIDEEEMLRMEAQERLYLAKTQLLYDVFSEDDSDPGRNPFESSEDDDDGDDERSIEGDEEIYSDEYYEDEYYEGEYNDMDENAILEQLQGPQSDIQALLMIPPEQQEQLLLLQHYAETHRLQQEQLQQKSQELNQPVPDQLQAPTAQQDSQLSGIMNTTGLVQPFDVNVPDLDAVSEQLAASLAKSLGSSMAEKIANGQPEDAPLFPTTIQDITQIDQLDAAVTSEGGLSMDDPGCIMAVPNASPVSPVSATPESNTALWNTPLSSTPDSVDSALIPTPANTPTPPATTTAASPSIPSVSEVDQSSLGESYTSSTIHNAQIVPLDGTLSQIRLHSEDPNSFKETAQYAIESVQTKAPMKESSFRKLNETSSPMHNSESRKHKSNEQDPNEVVSVNEKRRRLSDDNHVVLVQISQAQDISATSTAAITENSNSLNSNSVTPSLPATTPTSNDVSSASVSMSPTNADASTIINTNVEMTVADYDFSKAAMPFIDPAARIISPPPVPKLQTGLLRSRKHSLKGKEKQSDATVLPMDDLLDTSALYGRSSRSPSPDRGTSEGNASSEMSQSMKDLNRWERVPIGTFRRSRHPSSSYVGLQGALKFGNSTMPTTLLADHQLHQQQLAQESQRVHRRNMGARKFRSLSATSDRMPGMLRRENRAQGIGNSRLAQSQHLVGSYRIRAATVSSTIRSSPSIHASMMMEDLAAFGSPSITNSAMDSKYPVQRSQPGLESLGNSQMRHLGSSYSLLGEPVRRRRRTGHHLQRPDMRSSRSIPPGHSQQQLEVISSGLELALQNSSNLGVGMARFARPVGRFTNTGLGSNGTARASGVQDLMTDSSQLPSSACSTPLHSPLFSATTANGAIHHHGSGEPVISNAHSGKIESLSAGDDIVPHLDLDISKEMDGFQERLRAKSKATENKPTIQTGSTSQPTHIKDEDVDVDIEDEEESLKTVLLNATF